MNSSPTLTEKKVDSPVPPALHPAWLRAIGITAIAFNFLWFAHNALQAHFAFDEMMNMGWAWEAGIGKILAGIVQFYSNFYRPVGALYYWTLHQLFGLDPLPFRIVDFVIVLVNVYLVYRLTRLLSRSGWVAWLATFLFSYHQKINIWISYNGAFAYDRLFLLFYLLAFVVYLGPRAKGEPIRLGRGLGVAGLYILAMGSKEMAVSLPVMMVAYECLWHTPALNWTAVRRWVWRDVRWAIVLGLMTLAFVIGKTSVGSAMSDNPAYRPSRVTVGHFLESQAGYIREARFREARPSNPMAAAVALALMAALSLALRDRVLGYALLHVLITPLPIAFLERGGGCLYIVLIGWTLFAARAAVLLAETVVEKTRMRGTVQWIPYLAMMLLPAALLFQANVRYQGFTEQPMLHVSDPTWHAIQEIKRVSPRIPKGGTVAYVRTPFEGWDMYFITELWRRDRSLKIFLADKNHLTPADLQRMDVVLDYPAGGALREVLPE